MIRLSHVFKSFISPPADVLKDINLTIGDNEFISITGKSGSGKTTLLYILSALDSPTKGDVEIEGQSIHSINTKTLHHFRNQKMGFIFQSYFLLPELTAIENVLMPSYKMHKMRQKMPYAKELLKQFGFKEDLFSHYPIQLSGGEQQRIAIARALIMDPKYIFADEPTGNLDSVNANMVMNILKDIRKKKGTTIVYVTHDEDFAKLAERCVKLVDGRQIAKNL